MIEMRASKEADGHLGKIIDDDGNMIFPQWTRNQFNILHIESINTQTQNQSRNKSDSNSWLCIKDLYLDH